MVVNLKIYMFGKSNSNQFLVIFHAISLILYLPHNGYIQQLKGI